MKQTLHDSHPDIAAQLVDPTLATMLSKGSTKKVEWRCNLGHTWFASPNSRTSMGSGCPVCNGKVVLPGYNDLATHEPQIAAQLCDPSLATTLTPRSGRKVEWVCPNDASHIWTASVNTRTSGHGCPVCTSKKVLPGNNDVATTHPQVAAMLDDPSLATKVTAFSAKKLTWRCTAGHVWNAPVARITNGATCPMCSGLTAAPGETDLGTTHPELAAQLVDPSLATKLKAGTNKKVAWRCKQGHIWEASPNARAKERATDCPICTNRAVLPRFNDLATTHPALAAEALDDVTDVTFGSKQLVTWQCPKGHQWKARPNDRTCSNSGCPSCAASSYVSRGESELAEVIKALVGDATVRTTVRNLLPRAELDVVVDDGAGLKVAFEFNGVWWHSEAHLDKSYHQSKSRAAAQHGYRLVHVWSDDWDEKRDVVIRGVAHRLNATNRLLDVLPDLDPKAAQRVFARKLAASSASSAEARAFWTANHLQGPVGSTYHFSLRDEDNQIRAMLGVGAKNHGSRAKAVPGVWDVQRYATLGRIPGGFTKLLAHAAQTMRAAGEQVTTWTSYSDDDVSDGGMYEAAGFTVDKTQQPSYAYIGAKTQWKRAHRTQFVKQRFVTDDTLLYEDGWTEHQAALANGLYRVYDAGKTRWVKDV